MNEGLGPCEQPPMKMPNRKADSQLTTLRIIIKTWHIMPYWQLEFKIKPHETTVAQMKQTIFDMTGYPIEKQRICTAGRLMRDDKMVSAYKLFNDETIFMVKDSKSTGFLRQQLSRAGMQADEANYVMKSASSKTDYTD